VSCYYHRYLSCYIRQGASHLIVYYSMSCQSRMGPVSVNPRTNADHLQASSYFKPILPTINMVSSPLAGFLSRLQGDSTLSSSVVVVSDNARISRTVVAHIVYSQKPVRRSRWGPEMQKIQPSPKVPARGLSPYLPTVFIHAQRMDVPFPALSSLQHDPRLLDE
jgi:hypothetical protein